MRYSTLLWDLDGTLYDFEKNQERSLRRILEEFGVDASEENVACYLRIKSSAVVGLRAGADRQAGDRGYPLSADV